MDGRRSACGVALLGGLLMTGSAVAARPSQALWPIVTDGATGVVVIGLGLSLALLRPRRQIGLVLTAAGAAWFLGGLTVVPGDIGAAAAALTFLHRGVMAHAIIALPTGRLATPAARAAVLVGYVICLIPPLWTNVMATTVVCAAFAIGVVASAARAPGRARRSAAFGAWASATLAAGIILGALVRAIAPTPAATAVALTGYEGTFVLSAVLITAAALVRDNVAADTVIEAADAPGRTMQDALGWAVGDPALRLGRMEPDGGFADPDGRSFAAAPGRQHRVVRDGDRAIAMVDVAAGVLADSELADTLDSAVRINARNADLRAEVAQQVANVAASRRRIASAADDEQRRLQDRLACGPGARLTRIGTSLDEASIVTGADDRRAIEELATGLSSVRDLVIRLQTGLYPRRLAESGLTRALEEVVASFPIPVDLVVDESVDGLPEGLTLTAYYVTLEGLANAAKHAHATQIQVTARHRDQLTIAVRDNGIGGADPRARLGGLRDRVAVSGGSILLESPSGHGTTLTVALPTTAGPSS